MSVPLSLPNLITFCNIFFGFASVVAVVRSSGGESFGLTQAAWFIIIAAIFDALDGKLARKMNRQSHFGMELDSLADVVSFGLAPSILIYHAYFQGWFEQGRFWGLLGILVASLPLIFGSFRLARFNMESTESSTKPMFSGMPIPVGAGLIATFILFNQAHWGELVLRPFVLPLVLLCSLLMVSRVPVDPMPRLTFRESGRNKVLLLMLLGTLASILLFQAKVLFPIVLSYVLYCVGRHFLNLLRHSAPDEEDMPDNSSF